MINCVIYKLQDNETGGISDMPGDLPGSIPPPPPLFFCIQYLSPYFFPNGLSDVFHCFFGIGGINLFNFFKKKNPVFIQNFAGLSLMGYCDLVDLDPAYALPVETLEKHNIKLPWKNYKKAQK